jgi:hypothetical protein
MKNVNAGKAHRTRKQGFPFVGTALYIAAHHLLTCLQPKLPDVLFQKTSWISDQTFPDRIFSISSR